MYKCFKVIKKIRTARKKKYLQITQSESRGLLDVNEIKQEVVDVVSNELHMRYEQQKRQFRDLDQQHYLIDQKMLIQSNEIYEHPQSQNPDQWSYDVEVKVEIQDVKIEPKSEPDEQ